VRRRVILGFAVLVLVALGGASALVWSRPEVRARWHLRRVSHSEFTFSGEPPLDVKIALTGHAKAFAESPCVQDLIPELVELARQEGGQDEKYVYRRLLGVIATEPYPADVLSALAACLSSKQSELRVLTIARLRSDPRIFAVMARHARTVFHEPTSDGREETEMDHWFRKFAMDHEGLLGSPITRESAPDPTDQRMWDSIYYAALSEWVDANRSRLPAQIDPR
jgi:hypothetical protein